MVKSNLKDFFPMIQTRAEILQKINAEPRLKRIYSRWNNQYKKKFLDFMTGAAGGKMLYDAFFKAVMNPERDPERLNRFLSLILKQKVTVKEVLPLDSVHMNDETALIIMDIVVQLEDGSIANLEVQKMGRSFPGQRAACYSADLLLRQYKRVKATRAAYMEDKPFSYREIKNVYTVVLIERSTKNFHQFVDTYLHYFEQKSNTGLELQLLQKYCFVSLDIFKEILHNNNCIGSELEAWLTFFAEDEAKWIIRLIENYPYFTTLYEEIYQKCLDIEEVMGMFSEELAEMDRNEEKLMIDEMLEELDEKRTRVEELDAQMMALKAQMKEREAQMSKWEAQMAEWETQMAKQNELIAEKSARIAELEAMMKERKN